MSAPTPPSRPPHVPAARPPLAGSHAPTVRIAAVRPGADAPAVAGPALDRRRRLVLPAGSTRGTAFDLAARVGTAVTLVALLVLAGAVLGVVDETPAPAGAATAGR